MNKKNIITFSILLLLGVFTGVSNKFINDKAFANQYNKIAAVQTKTPVKTTKTTPQTQNNKVIIPATSLNIVANPNKYINKTVKMQATFDKFSTLGLDYKKALRSSENYIGILIQRDDVTDHNIPLSEMKLFLTKELAEKHIDLDCGDKIEITAREFSTALGDPWLDVENIAVIKKVKKEEKNN